MTTEMMLIGDDHMLPSMLEAFPDLDSHLTREDLEANDNDNEQNNDNGNGGFSDDDASEKEFKFDPSEVKDEVDGVFVEAQEEDPFNDPFLAVVSTANKGGAEEAESSGRKPRQRRKPKRLDSDDDEEDKTWSIHSSNKPKRKSVPGRPRKRGPEKMARQKIQRVKTLDRGEKERSSPFSDEGDDEKIDGGNGNKIEDDVDPPVRRRRGRPPRKKVSDMSPEEQEKARAKWREEKLRQRGSPRFLAQSGFSDTESVDEAGGASEVKSSNNHDRKRVSAITDGERLQTSENDDGEGSKDLKYDPDFPPVVKRAAGGRRKRISEMTDVEREVMKARWREESRLKRQRQRERWTEEERREYLAKQNERKRQLRQAIKQSMSPEKKSEIKISKKTRESKKDKPKLPLTEEQKREAYQKRLLRRIEKEAMMTEEEKEEKKQRATLRRLEKEAKMTPEELEMKRKRKMEYARQRLSKMTEEERKQRREKMRQYRENMSPEQKSQFLSRLREAHYKRMAKVRQDPVKLAELKEKWQSDKKKRQEYLKEWKRKIRSGEVSREEMMRREEGGRRGRGRKPIDPKDMSEDLLRNRAEKRKTASVKARIKRRLKIQQMLDSGLSMEEISRQTETTEQRQRRLMRNRIDSAKIRMRKKLESVGAPPKVIEVKLMEIAETYQPKHAMRPYKPRESRRKPVNETDLALLESLERKTEKKSEAKPSIAPVVNAEPLPPPQPIEFVELTPCASGSVISYTSSTMPTINRLPPREVTIEYHVGGDVIHYEQYHYEPQTFPPQGVSQVIQIETVPGDVLQPITQAQSLSLQHILNTMSFQEQPTAIVTSTTDNVRDFGHQQTNQDYSSSTVSYVVPPSPPPPDYSPPAFPINQQDHVKGDDTKYLSTPDPDHKEVPSSGKGNKKKQSKRSSNVRKPRSFTNLPDYYKTGVARGPKKKLGDRVRRDAVCEECGNAYAKNYITEHKRQMHNPDFKNGRCVPCGLEFRKAKEWWFHYSHEHLGFPMKPKPGEGKRAERRRLKEMGLLQGRIKKEIDPEKNPYMCPQCGCAFPHPSVLENHEYHMHGDGAKEENFFQCKPCQKKFKRKHAYVRHMRTKHADYKELVPCERCDLVLKDLTDLNQHIQEFHQDSYFPCKFCSAVKLSKVAWKFHTNRCAKITREQLLELRNQWKENGEPEPVDRLPVQCEFCPRKILLFSVRRHYKDMHGLDEERMFQCGHCRNTFKSREYYSAHLESVHRIPLEECLEICRKYNNVSREALVVKNMGGEKGGSRPQRTGKKSWKNKKNIVKEGDEVERSESEERNEIEVKKKQRPAQRAGSNKKLCKQRRKRDFLESQESIDKKERKIVKQRKRVTGTKQKRKSHDENISSDENEDLFVPDVRRANDDDNHSRRPTRRSAQRAQKIIQRFQRRYSDDSDEDEEEDEHSSPSQNNSDGENNDTDTCDKTATAKSEKVIVQQEVFGEEEEEASIKEEILSESEHGNAESENEEGFYPVPPLCPTSYL